MKNFYGIDLGTTNSLISTIVQDNIPIAFQIGRQESFAIPSVVYYPKDKEPVVGQLARNMLAMNPERCIQHIKREIGNETYERIIDGNKITPEIVLSDILRDIVKRANKKREEQGLPPVYDVVVSIPAKYGDLERKRTIKAVEIAGLKLIGLVHEPTAAAINFGLQREDNKTFIVYDLGGGTFDVNIMRIKSNELQILSKCGDLHCGGVDWDAEIVRMAIASLANENKLPEVRDILRNNETFQQFLQSNEGQAMLALAEEVKINLCDEQCPEDYDFTFTIGETRTIKIFRDQFFNNTSHLISRTINKMIEAIEEANIPINNIEHEIDEIIMVGGASYMPQVETAIRNRFKVRNIHRQEPGLAIAKGAALYANMQDRSWANTVRETKCSENDDTSDVIPVALPETPSTSILSTPHIPEDRIETSRNIETQKGGNAPWVHIHEIGGRSYGIVARDGKCMVIYNIIKMNDDIEITKEIKGVFVTNRANQKEIDLDVREYDSNAEIVDLYSIKSKRITHNIRIPINTDIPIGTPVNLKVKRDRNGVIYISVSCMSHQIDIELK